MNTSPTSSAVRRSEQAPSGMLAYACSHAGLWLNQIPTFDTEKPLG
jgi:hypothetical protein